VRTVTLVLLLAGSVSAQIPWAEVHPLGSGTPGTQGVPVLEMGGLPAVNQPSPGLRITKGRPNALAQLVVGTETAPAFIPKYAATLYPAPILRLLTTLDGAGASPSFLPLPSATPASLLGAGFTLQGLVLDRRATGGAAFTGAIELVFGMGSAAAQLFADPQTFLEAGGVAVALGDLDEDGRLDAVTAGEDGTVTVAIRSPLGDLFPVATLASGGVDGKDVELADLDEDGHLDLVVAWGSSASGFGQLGLRLGDGDGGFGALSTLGTGVGCHAVEAGDVDGDGHLDLVATRNKGLLVYRGSGDGGFGAIWAIFMPTFEFETQLALADVTGDAALDALVSPLGDDVLLVAEGAGDGTFSPPAAWPLGFWKARALAVGDVDGDGRQDAAVGVGPVSGKNSAAVVVLPGEASGGFAAAVTTVLPTGPVASLELGLMDGDASLDAVIARELDDFFGITTDVAVLRGLGDASFGPIGTTRTVATTDLALADLDGDGLVDAAATAPHGHVLQVLRGDGDGAFLPPAGTTDLLGVSSIIAATDLDGDGDVDLVAFASDAAVLRILENDGVGGFAKADTISFGSFSWDVEVADVTGDFLPDIVAIGFDTDDGIAVMLNQGGLAFSAPLITASPPGLFELGQVETGLLDGDGQVDLLLHGLATVNTSRLFVLHGAGNGSFTLVETQAGVQGSYFFVDLADVNADGKLDAVGSVFGQEQFAWHPGGGDGTLGDGIVVALPEDSGYVTAAELDGEPGDELVFTPMWYAGNDFEHIQVARPVGGGAFEVEVYVAPDRLSPVDVGDVNGDGAADLLGASLTTGTVTLWLGLGGGAFAPAQPFLSGAGGYPRVGDVNGDSLLDVVTSAGNSSLVVLQNKGGAAASP
jgi:hypothetical protein